MVHAQTVMSFLLFSRSSKLCLSKSAAVLMSLTEACLVKSSSTAALFEGLQMTSN
jgi:hypothetical protein